MPSNWYWANSAGGEELMHKLAAQCASDFPEILLRLARCAQSEHQRLKSLMWANANTTQHGRALAQRLASAFNRYGSDKSTIHDYHELYGELLCRFRQPTILEVGLGSNNTDIPSNMGVEGKPGASLRGFRDVFPESVLVGADVDDSITVENETVYYLDQTNINSFSQLLTEGPLSYDLIIDDGLHAPNANLNTLTAGLQRLSVSGVMAIEDIPDQAIDVWQLVPYLLGSSYDTLLVRMQSAFVFLVCAAGNPILRAIGGRT